MEWKRVILGGLAAGVFLNVTEGVLNAVILMDDYEALMQAYGIVEESWAMVGYVLGTFIFGFGVAWLYAAIRPRHGAGPMTGVVAGTALWVIGYVPATIWSSAWGLSLGVGETMLMLVWGLVEMMLAGVIAGFLYQEGEAVGGG